MAAAVPETTTTTKTLKMAAAEPETTISFSIWPPTDRTRDSVTKNLVESFSTASILSKRYGTLPSDEAAAVAGRIEDESFSAAAAAATAADDDDGIEILQVYSKEISKRMLDYMKSRSASPAAGDSAVDGEEGSIGETVMVRARVS